MSEFVQYHNVDKQGPVRYSSGKTGIWWKANRSIPIGARVWLVAGETIAGHKRYRLYDWFIVDEVSKSAGRRYALGSKVNRFDPPVEIGELPWFRSFLTYMGNFGRGVSPLRPDDVRNFDRAAVTLRP